MSVSCPIAHELLVRYWARDVSDDEAAAIEEHVFACGACFDASSRVAALARTLAEVIPPVAIGVDLAHAEARGIRRATNDFRPGVPKEAWLHPGTDLLVHRLLGEFGDVAKVAVDFVLPDGKPFLSFGDVPFEPSDGAVVIACQRHFVERFQHLSMDVSILVRRTHRDGRESADTYVVLHRLG
jgi:hypothetical protein